MSRGVYSAHAFIIRLPFIRSYFVEADRDGLYERTEPQKKTIEDPEMELTYSVSRKPLKQFEHTVVEQVAAQWSMAFGARKETVTRIKFVPGKETEEREIMKSWVLTYRTDRCCFYGSDGSLSLFQLAVSNA